MKADSTVQRNLKALRRDLIEGGDDPVIARVAQAMEYAIRWAREDVRGWTVPAEEARQMAAIIRQEFQA